MSGGERTAPKRALVLQGGGALGAYQAGVFEALDAEGYCPDWVAGTSIGAINAALIVGNAPSDRLPRLHAFWHEVSSAMLLPPVGERGTAREFQNVVSALAALWRGAPGMYRPRSFPAWALPGSAPDRLSYYDTTPLKASLERHVDFDRIAEGPARLSVGAVEVATGNVRYFDSAHDRIGPEHIMASGALPPGFPAVEIEGSYWWDGGLVSNTPLEHVLHEDPEEGLLVFQVDLFNARGMLPETMRGVEERIKDIRYSSRTRLVTDYALDRHRSREAVRRLLDKLPEEMRDDPDVTDLHARSRPSEITVVQLIHQGLPHGRDTKDYEFSRATMAEHWAAGLADARRSLESRDTFTAPVGAPGIRTFDASRADPLRPADAAA